MGVRTSFCVVQNYESIIETNKANIKKCSGECCFGLDKKSNHDDELFLAEVNQNFNRVKLFVENGGDVNTKNDEGETLLHLVAEKGYFEIVKYYCI